MKKEDKLDEKQFAKIILKEFDMEYTAIRALIKLIRFLDEYENSFDDEIKDLLSKAHDLMSNNLGLWIYESILMGKVTNDLPDLQEYLLEEDQ